MLYTADDRNYEILGLLSSFRHLWHITSHSRNADAFDATNVNVSSSMGNLIKICLCGVDIKMELVANVAAARAKDESLVKPNTQLSCLTAQNEQIAAGVIHSCWQSQRNMVLFTIHMRFVFSLSFLVFFLWLFCFHCNFFSSFFPKYKIRKLSFGEFVCREHNYKIIFFFVSSISVVRSHHTFDVFQSDLEILLLLFFGNLFVIVFILFVSPLLFWRNRNSISYKWMVRDKETIGVEVTPEMGFSYFANFENQKTRKNIIMYYFWLCSRSAAHIFDNQHNGRFFYLLLFYACKNLCLTFLIHQKSTHNTFSFLLPRTKSNTPNEECDYKVPRHCSRDPKQISFDCLLCAGAMPLIIHIWRAKWQLIIMFIYW